MTVRPLHDRVLVKGLSAEEVTKAGIILPDTVDKEKPEKGEVVAVGPGKLRKDGTREPLAVKVGDKILFKKYAPDEIKVDNQEYLVLREEDIIAVIE